MVAFGKPALLQDTRGRHCAIEASAGTGKTFTLEHLIVQLILDGTLLENILVVTFTKKATLELKARVRAKLTRLVALDKDSVRPGEIPCELTPEGLARLQAALMAFDRSTISTIHGFCQQVLRDTAFEGGHLFQQEAVSSAEAFERAFTTLLRTDYATRQANLLEVALRRLGTPSDLRDLLSEAMKEEACLELPDFKDARSFLEAFPARLAQDFLTKGSALPAQFSAKPKAMGNRLQTILDLRAACLASDRPEDFWLATGWATPDNVEAFCEDLPPGDAAVLAKGVLDLANFKAVLVAAFLPPLRQELRRFKAAEGLFDFDDMIKLVADALAGPQGKAVVARLRERFQVALIDEFQDTDDRQWAIFSQIFLVEGHQLFLVGDPKQSIYGFRGGDLPTYVTALEALEAMDGARVLQLKTNYRSTEGVINGYNAIFADTANVSFFSEANATHYQHPVGCGKPDLRLVDAEDRELPPIRVVDVPVGNARSTGLTAAAALARALEETLAGARFLGADRATEALGPADVFVLTRTKSEGRIMAEALRARGIPAALYRQEGLFDGPEAEACRDLMLAIASPFDACRRAKVLLGPFFGLNLREAERARDLPEGHPILKRLFAWRDLAGKGHFGELFNRVVSESGLSQRLLFLEEGQRALTNTLHILELLQRYALAGHCTLADLAVQAQRWIEGQDRPAVEEGDTQRLERQGGAVQVLTMHKAKGLEAPIVILFGGTTRGGSQAVVHRYHQGGRRRAWVGSTGLAPASVQAYIETEEREEGERLAYVALTRAQGQLILPCYVAGPEPLSNLGNFDAACDPKKGLYRDVNRRLKVLVEPASAPPRPFHRTLPRAVEPPASRPQLGPWVPDLPQALKLLEFPALRRLGRPRWLFSYSSLQRGLAQDGGEGAPAEEVKTFTATDGPRGGKKLGTKVHAMLQRVAPAAFAGVDEAAWMALPATRALANAWLPEEGRKDALRWIYHAMTVPYPLMDGGAAPLHSASELIRELDFLTPHTGEDFLTGSMDVLFQTAGKTYVLDWKTNRLEGFGPEALEQAVREHYWLQVRIYAVTTCRFLGIQDEAEYQRSFGGVIYVFLRGLPGEGVWTLRPTWAELQAWQAELAALRVDSMIPQNAGGQARVR